MRKFCFFLLGLLLCINTGDALGATRGQNTINATSRQSVKTARPETTNRTLTSRTTSKTVSQRQPSARNASNKIVSSRSAEKKRTSARTTYNNSRASRAATITNVKNRTFGTNYNLCRDAYFTCMDQFCATQNETYRRCVCSSKLKDIQTQERLLSQTYDSLQDFESLNIDTISKTAGEVKAMISAANGESAIKTDTSSNNALLHNISNIVSNAKKKSLSTQGTLDIGGDIRTIWTTTNLIGGSDIANLTGENLFNAVHAQCSEMAATTCASSDLKMVSSAYGMYVENDCAIIENNLKTKQNAANVAIREMRHKMQDARLDNYDAHNSKSINDCIANVRQDILSETACGANYVHCLDFSGKYLNITSGDPIYSPEFYQIENQISLSGDIVKNNQNASFVSMLNKKRSFAEKDLDLCRDNADEVWNEFLRQAIVEIYQQQQQRVKIVKEECLQVVNQCYVKQSEQLTNLNNEYTKTNLVQTLELSEEMCREKLDTCSNLYGGGSDGLAILVATMTGINDAMIEQSCPDLLDAFARNICAVPSNDSIHAYPYGCRKYAPGESRYARTEICNTTFANPFSRSEILTTMAVNESNSNYLQMCINKEYIKKYISCKPNYYLYNEEKCTNSNTFCFSEDDANECHACPSTAICAGGTYSPMSLDSETTELYNQCGEYYVGSLYQQFVIYALQNCTRQSNTTNVPSESLLMDIDNIVQQIRVSMITALAQECENQKGEWINMPWIDRDLNGKHDETNDTLQTDFYTATGSNTLWGYCKNTW